MARRDEIPQPPLEPHEVFTPAGSVGPHMFATRAHHSLETRIVDALREPGRHVMVHGWTGVGKTSLIHHLCDVHGLDHVAVECGGSFEQLMHHVLNRLGERASADVVEASGRSAELAAGPLGLFSAKTSGQRSTQERSTGYPLPLETLVVEALARARIHVLFVDNLEDLQSGADERHGLCRLIKACSGRTRDLGAGAPKVVIAGPSAAVQELLLTDEAAARRTEQIEVPRMPDDEIEQILVRGQVLLGMSFEDGCREEIVEYAGGFPFYAHLYALQCSRLARRRGRRVITLEDFATALDDIVGSCSSKLAEAYARATRARGEPALRIGALSALAAGSMDASVHEIQERFLALHPQYERIERVRFVGRLLRELRDEHGVLEDARLVDGAMGYRFRDPLMRVYVRLRMLQDRQRAEARWRASLPP